MGFVEIMWNVVCAIILLGGFGLLGWTIVQDIKKGR